MKASQILSHIVLVDDDTAQAGLYASLLSRAFDGEIRLAVFSDSEQAVAHIDSNLVDMLITDLRMPKVDGLQLIRHAKSRFPGVQVLLMTAKSSSASLVEATDIGADDYLLKPFAKELLIDLVVQARNRLSRWRVALAGTLQREHSHTSDLAHTPFLDAPGLSP